MAKVEIEKIRNVALVGHGDAGKTALAEDLLFRAGALKRRGRVEEGNTAADFDEEEIKRGFSVSAALLAADYKGYRINLLDVPGSADFIFDLIAGIRVADVALVVVNAVAGVEVGTERGWREAEANRVARAAVVNKMDRERADFGGALRQLRDAFAGVNFVVMTYPVGAEAAFKGYLDVARGVAVLWEGGLTGEPTEAEVPADLADKFASLNNALVEAAAEQEDELMEKYFDAGGLSDDDVARGLLRGIANGKVVPVFCADAYDGVGGAALLEAVLKCFPSPADVPARVGVEPGGTKELERPAAAAAPLSGFVFKTVNDPFAGKLSYVRIYSGKIKADEQVRDVNADVKFKVTTLVEINGKTQKPVSELAAGELGAVVKAEPLRTGDTITAPGDPVQYAELVLPEPVMPYAISPRSKGDEDKLTSSLGKLTEEDPTFHVERNTETKELVASGMGEQHLQVMFSKLGSRFGVAVDAKVPRVAYRETVRKGAKAQGRYKKQTGGRGQFGDVWLELEPLERGAGFEFVNKIFGGAIPSKFVPSVEKGVVEAMAGGVLAGYPVVDLRVTLYDGSFHTVDSSDLAFKIAGSLGFKKAFGDASPTILEPIMEVTVRVPPDYMGAVTGDLSGKRGRVMGMEPAGIFQEVKALVPQAEIFRFSSDLRSMTAGKGSFTVRLSHYEEAPPDVAKKVVEASQRQKEES
ncbi:MAG: elongation factor G [candidate division Zixibacteria bacterium]|nr:elongation factor G [candidate division Zixibacteria bacterium]